MSIELFLIAQAVIVALNGIAIFFIKKNIEHGFSSRLADLEAKNRMQALEHQVRFTRFDEKVAAAIEGAYELVCEYRDAAVAVIESSHEGDETIKKSYDQAEVIAKKFSRFMRRQSIYLPNDVANNLSSTRSALRDEYFSSLQEMKKKTDKTILFSVYAGGALQKRCDELMDKLQVMVRDHLSQFVLSPKS